MGPVPAQELIATGRIYETAEADGWTEQLEFNEKMIWMDAISDNLAAAITANIPDELPKPGKRLDKFGVPKDELATMRAKAIFRKLKFSNLPVASGDEEAE